MPEKRKPRTNQDKPKASSNDVYLNQQAELPQNQTTPPEILLDSQAIDTKLTVLTNDPRLTAYRRTILLCQTQLNASGFTDEEKLDIRAELEHAKKFYQLRRRILINHERKLERQIVKGHKPTIWDHPATQPILSHITVALGGCVTSIIVIQQFSDHPIVRRVCSQALSIFP